MKTKFMIIFPICIDSELFLTIQSRSVCKYKIPDSHPPDQKPDDNSAPYKVVNQARKNITMKFVTFDFLFKFL